MRWLPLPLLVILAVTSYALSGCATSADAQSTDTAVATYSSEAALCGAVAGHLDSLDSSASADEFRDFAAKVAHDLAEASSDVGVDLAIANSYAMLLGIDASEYRNPEHRLDTAYEFVQAMDTYVSSCVEQGVRMPAQWVPPTTQTTTSGPQGSGDRSSQST